MVYSVGGVGTNYGKGYSLPKPDIHHHRKADDLRAGFEIAKWGAFCHPLSLRNHPTLLKRAKHRCELCGGHEDQVALHVDHIIPRSKGGPDDISNFQALCMTCNTRKRDTDDTDFRGVLDSYSDRKTGCIFCEIGAGRIIADCLTSAPMGPNRVIC